MKTISLFRIIAIVFCLSGVVSAQTWSGGGFDVNWSTSANWAGGLPPVSGTSTAVVFDGTTNVTGVNQNILNPFVLDSLTFTSGLGAFTSVGNQLQFQGTLPSITMNSNNPVTISNNIALGNTWSSNDALTINGSGAGTLTLGGTVSGWYTGVIKNAPGEVDLSGAFNFPGSLTVNSGLLKLNPSGDLPVNDDAFRYTVAGGATLDLNGMNATGHKSLSGSGVITNSNVQTSLLLGNISNVDVNITLTGNIRFAKYNVGYNTYVRVPQYYTGGTEIWEGVYVPQVNNALGTGTVDVYGGTLNLTGTAQNYVGMPTVNVNDNAGTGWGAVGAVRSGGLVIVGPNNLMTVNLNGGTLSPQSWAGVSPEQYFGAITVSTTSTLAIPEKYGHGNVFNGPITNAPGKTGTIVVDFGSDSADWVTLNNSGNTWNGGLKINAGYIRSGTSGSLGAGPVSVQSGLNYTTASGGLSGYYYAGGRLRTEAAGSLTSPISVTVNPEGLLDIASDESNPGKAIVVKTGGALLGGGATAFQYDSAQLKQNFALEQGAILDGGMSGAQLPSYDVVKNRLGAGDGLFGLYQARTGVYTAAVTFGDDGVSNIWRGLAVANNGLALTFRGTAVEGASSTSGIGFYSQVGSTLTLDGANGANITVNGTNPVRVNGLGATVLAGAVGGNFTTIEKGDKGTIQVNTTGGIAGKTVNVHAGRFIPGTGLALDGATVNVGADAIYSASQDISLTTGTVNLNNGSFVRLTTPGAASVGKLNFSGHVVVCPEPPNVNDAWDMSAWPKFTATNYDLALPYRYSGVVLPANGIALGNGSRITVRPDQNPYWNFTIQNSGAGIMLAPAPAVQEGVLAAAYTDMWVNARVNFTGGKLLVGDTSTLRSLRTGNNTFLNTIEYTDLSQSGQVILNNGTNAIGSINARAGILQFTSAGALGGANPINVQAGANLRARNFQPTLTATITGAGTLDARDDYNPQPGWTWTLQPTLTADAALAPTVGAAGSRLTVNGNLTLSKVNVNTAPAVTFISATAAANMQTKLVSNLLDGNLANGWEADNGHNADWAVLQTASDVTASGLTLGLYADTSNTTRMVLKFQVSVTTSDRSLFGGANGNGSANGVTWTPLVPTSVLTTRVESVTIDGTGAVTVATNDSPPADNYAVGLPALTGVTGIRLDCYPVGGVGPGRSGSGNMQIGELTLGPAPIYNYTKFAVNIAGGGGVAGQDFSQLAVTGNADLSGGQVVVDLPLPSGTLNPDVLATKTMTIATIAGTRSGAFAGPVRSASTSVWWQLDPGALSYSGTNVMLSGTGLAWTAIKGDATLDGLVNVADLGILANHYGQTGQGWATGDFTYDGLVNVADLGVLANHYGQSQSVPTGSGVVGATGGPVPEPATLVILGLGGLLALRRRNKK